MHSDDLNDFPEQLKQAENLLRDRCSSFVIAVVYDEQVAWSMSGSAAAYGLVSRVKQMIEVNWDHEDRQDLEKEF